MTRISKKEQQRLDELAEKEPCQACNAQGVYKAGFKFWKTCQECEGKKYV